MAKWYKLPTHTRMTHGEYRANVQGLNILFGAVLGFVLADASAMPLENFAIVLAVSAGTTVGVLYLQESDHKLFYAGLNIFILSLMPGLLDRLDAPPNLDRLVVTFAVWAAMVLLIELVPRQRDDTHTTEGKEP